MKILTTLVKFLGVGLLFLAIVFVSVLFLYHGVLRFIEIAAITGWYAVLNFFSGLILIVIGIFLLIITGLLGSAGLEDFDKR